MFHAISKLMRIVVLTGCVITGSARTSLCEEASNVARQFWCDARLFSLNESEGLDSYESYTAGGAEPTTRLILEAETAKRQFSVRVSPVQENGRFIVNVLLIPHESDKETKKRIEKLDLSNLKPRVIDVAKDDDGRVYRLTLVPRIILVEQPKRFRSADLLLHKWHFQHSPVILNDQEYLGLLNMGSGEIAWVDVPGLAKIEFSLLPLSGAEPEGLLRDGTLRITHNSDTIRITNVRNGISSRSLPGGPYLVWVRWKKPSETIDEYRDSLTRRIHELRERAERGELELPTETVERLERLAKSGRVLQIQSGLRQATSNEARHSDSDGH